MELCCPLCDNLLEIYGQILCCTECDYAFIKHKSEVFSIKNYKVYQNLIDKKTIIYECYQVYNTYEGRFLASFDLIPTIRFKKLNIKNLLTLS